MSRLDSFLRRMTAQKLLLERAAELIADVPGPVVELGLGAGRTYDHLRELLPEREIFAFDSVLQAAVGALPEADHMIVGDIRETLAFAGPRIGARAALVHNDLGSGDEVYNAATSAWLSPLVAAIIAPRAIVVTSFPLALPGASALPLPPGIKPGRYHIFRAAAARSAPDASGNQAAFR
jgi:hypothetical protein